MKVRLVEPLAMPSAEASRSLESTPWHDQVVEPRPRPRATEELAGGEWATGANDAIEGRVEASTEPYLVAYTRWLLGEIDWSVTGWMAAHRVRLIQLALGVIFLWFGGLKLVPGLSPAEDLVVATAQALLAPVGLGVPGRLVIALLALWEVSIGLGFLLDRHRKAMVWMLIVHMGSTALPLVLLPEIVWTHVPYGLTLEGQYIVKNLVILAGVATVGATMHGGYLNWAPPGSEPVEPDATGDQNVSLDASTAAAAPPPPAGRAERPSSPPPATTPRVWIVDEDGSLLTSYALEGYYDDGPHPGPRSPGVPQERSPTAAR